MENLFKSLNSNNYKECKSCLVLLSNNCFSDKSNKCKDCINNINKNKYSEEKVKERIPYRNKFFKKYLDCAKGPIDIEEYNIHYVKIEKYNEMKNDNNYTFCECDEIRRLDKVKYKDDYKEKYFLDVVMCRDNIMNVVYKFNVI